MRVEKNKADKPDAKHASRSPNKKTDKPKKG